MSLQNNPKSGSAPYEAPQVIRLGSIVELTRNNRGSGEARQGGNNSCNGNGGPVGC